MKEQRNVHPIRRSELLGELRCKRGIEAGAREQSRPSKRRIGSRCLQLLRLGVHREQTSERAGEIEPVSPILPKLGHERHDEPVHEPPLAIGGVLPAKRRERLGEQTLKVLGDRRVDVHRIEFCILRQAGVRHRSESVLESLAHEVVVQTPRNAKLIPPVRGHGSNVRQVPPVMLPGRSKDMIVKPPLSGLLPSDPKLRAGVEAERQMAHYLHRAFVTDPDIFVLNDIRLVDPDQPEHDGQPGVCQVDHLVLHRWGALVIESKSVTDEVAVQGDGAGGDEWTRKYRGREQGFASPIQQARRQGEFLRVFLQSHRTELLGKIVPGLRTLAKVIHGTDQRGFRDMPIQIVVAISDGGKIRRMNNWTEPTTPFRTFVSKADLVPGKIREEFAKHRAAWKLSNATKSEYGMWWMKAEEVGVVAEYLLTSHKPRVTTAAPECEPPHMPPLGSPEKAIPKQSAVSQSVAASKPSVGASCKQCAGTDLVAKWGKYGYYWACNACNTNTAMPAICSACGAEGQRGKTVKIRKDGPKFYRACEQCSIEEMIWTAAGSHAS